MDNEEFFVFIGGYFIIVMRGNEEKIVFLHFVRLVFMFVGRAAFYTEGQRVVFASAGVSVAFFPTRWKGGVYFYNVSVEVYHTFIITQRKCDVKRLRVGFDFSTFYFRIFLVTG